MKAWIKDNRVVFLPLKGAVPVDATNIVEETDAPVGANEEPGAIDRVTLEPNGKVRVVRKVRPEYRRTKAKRDIAAASNVAQLRKALLDYLE